MSDLAIAATLAGAAQKRTSNIINAAGTAANALRGSLSNGGSSSSGRSSASGYADAWSNTAGNLASERARLNALEANTSAKANWEDAAEWNARQAQINREWQEYMSNTQYQRAIKDMKAAGINPILAAQGGISSASIGSGAQASMSAPETFMGQTIAEQNSASHSENQSQSESHGSSWQHSESGLATGLKLMGDAISGALGNLNSANTINVTLDALKNEGLSVGKEIEDTAKTTAKQSKNAAQKVVTTIKKGAKNAKDWAKNKANKAKTKYNKNVNRNKEINAVKKAHGIG